LSRVLQNLKHSTSFFSFCAAAQLAPSCLTVEVSVSHTLRNTHTHTLRNTHTLTHSETHTHSHTQKHTHTHTLRNTHTLTHSETHTHSHTQKHTHTHTLRNTHTLTHSETHTHTHSRGMIPLYERSARRIGRYLYNTQQAEETNIHSLSGIRARDPSNLVASDLRIGPRGHRGLASIQLACS
jgi:hypothetical protein